MTHKIGPCDRPMGAATAISEINTGKTWGWLTGRGR